MNYCQIYDCDTANGPGMRVTLFVSGCTHHCKGCFNEKTWDFQYGVPYTKETENHIIELVNKSYISGLTILGGEPMEPSNQIALYSLISKIDKPIWVYSGYTFEEMINKHQRCYVYNVTEAILSNIDVLVDGEFMIDKKDITLPFRGSSNQRIIDMKKSYTIRIPILKEL